MRRVLIVAVVVALTAGSALATVPATDQFLPALGHALGQLDPITNTRPHWQGDVWIFNPWTTQTAVVEIYLLLRQANPNPTSQVITLAPGETRYLPDVILGTFGNSNLFAGLRFVSSIPVLVTGESYDANATIVNKPTGTAGQFFAALPANIALGVGDSSELPGFDQDGINTAGNFRSNLAVVETTGNPVNYTVYVYDGSGNLLGSKDYSLGVFEVGQINNVVTDVTGMTATNARLRVVVKAGSTGRLFAVGSRVDNRTNDPSTIDMVSIHNWGRFEGIVVDPTGVAPVGGGFQLQISNEVVTSYYAGTILCGSSNATSVDVTPDSVPTNLPVTNGAFSFQVTIPYTDSQTTVFTTTWTLSGTRAADGTWSGTLSGNTTGGSGLNLSCNGLVTSNWRAAWTGGTS